jgi:predicted anti-sigma-YlaC factor YlaD
MLQPFLDRDLNEEERALAEEHLNLCAYCRRRYRFEADLRRFVRQAVTEEMPPDLKVRLANLRTPLL